jgi:hypothetical protein
MIKNNSHNVSDISKTDAAVYFVLIFFAVFCSLGSIISAFTFSVNLPVLSITLFAISLTACLLSKYFGLKGLLFLFIPAFLLLIFWFHDLSEATKWVLFYISNDYSTWLFVPVLFDGAEATNAQQTIFYIFAGVLLTFPIAYSICIRRSLLFTALFSAPILLLTFVHQYSPPEPLFFIGLLAVYITLLFLNRIIIPGFIEKRYTVYICIILAIVLLGAAYIAAPQQDFIRNRFVISLDYHLRGVATRIGLIRTKTGVGWPNTRDDTWSFDTNNIDISEAGTRVITDKALLEILASEPGVFYLRGYSMQKFDGNSWSSGSNDSHFSGEYSANMLTFEIIDSYARANNNSSATLVHMFINRSGDRTENIAYLPYYSPPGGRRETAYQTAFFHSDKSIAELYELLATEARPSLDLTNYRAYVYSSETYLQINEYTASGLRQFAADYGFDLTADKRVIANQVAFFFSSFGQYTLSPLLISEEEDFALYFLNHSKHGYCIHYATAATLLLRALGIPARFTVGFVASVNEDEVNQPIVLTDGNAHAWVEVFFDDFGWLPLEVTPFSEEVTGAYRGGTQPGDNPLPVPGFMGDMLGDGPFFDDFMEDYIGGTELDGQNTRSIRTPLIILLIAVGCIISLIVRRVIILTVRKKNLRQADTNAATVYAWSYLVKLTGPDAQRLIAKSIKEIALKAGFSQHRLTEDERERVIGYTTAFAENAYQHRSQPARFVMKYIFGL